MNQEIKNQIQAVFKKYPVKTVYLFGSQANGRANKFSDYDFAAQISSEIPTRKYAKLKLDLIGELLKIVDANLVDLVILNDPNIPILLKFNIIKDGRVIFEKKERERKKIEFEIMRHWLDWQYFENLWHKIFLKNLASGKIL